MRTQSKWYRVGWPEKVVLPIAAIIAGGAFTVWIIGVLSLVGYSHQRFDSAMFVTAIKAELILILPIWLFLRAADIGVRVLSRLSRPSLRAVASAGLLPTAQ
jgi:hypothetical protein